MPGMGISPLGCIFFRGPYQNSPYTWDVERCQQRFGELARMPARKFSPQQTPKA